MTFNTGNPIGSTDARDLSDNAENFDKALNSTAETWTDRLGVNRDSFEGRLAKGSFYRVGTFAEGYTLTNMRQTLEYNGHEYGWAGTFPKVVAPGATPATSGGIGAGAWVDRTDETLRSEIPDMPDVIAQRPSFNALPRVLKAFASYNENTDVAINIIGLGSSVGVGASLPNPATQAPVKYFASKLKSALDVGNIFNIASYNYSVNGSTISEYSAPLEQAVTDGKSPNLVVLAYGMNDGGVAIFNAGQTYPAIYTNAVKLIQRARELGSDVVIITTPHHRCNAVTYYMPDGVPQMYPVYVAAPVSPESLVPPASQSNITGDFTGAGKMITVSHRHLRVNQMFRRIASDYGIPVIDAEYFWFKALEKYGEDALFNAGEYLHPNLLGHQQSYHAAIDMFIEGLQRQTSQSIEPQLSGYTGINTQNPSAVLDIEVPYSASPKDTFVARARTGRVDGNGVAGSGTVWKVEAYTGDLVGYQLSKVDSTPVEFYRIHGDVPSSNIVVDRLDVTQKVHSGTTRKIKSGAFNISGTQTLFDLSIIAASGVGELKVHGYQSGIGRKMYTVDFVMKSGVITLGAPAVVGDEVFTIATSGTVIKLVAASSNTNYNYELEFMYGT